MATKPKVKQAHIDLALQYLTKNMGIVSTQDMVRLYSQSVVDNLIDTKKVQPTVIVAEDKHNLMPRIRINAIFTHEWKRERPIWLDAYLAKLRGI